MTKYKIRRLWNKGKVLFKMLSIKALRKKPFPFQVNLVVNSRCNLKCSYCYGQYPKRGTPDWPLAEIKKLVDELAARKTAYIVVQGGEALLHPDIDEIIGYIASKGIVVALSTNGQCPDRLKAMKNINLLDYLVFSLDGDREGNDRIRGKGSFDKVMRSIELTQEVHEVPIRINTTVTKHVVKDVDFLAEFTKKQGLGWVIGYLFRAHQAKGEEDCAPTNEEVLQTQAKVLEYKRQGYPILSATKILKYIYDWPLDSKRIYFDSREAALKFGKKAIHCQHGFYQIAIDEDGKVYPCHALQGVFQAKNLRETGFDQAFDHLRSKPCHTCYMTTMINSSAMINWDWDIIVETIKSAFRI